LRVFAFAGLAMASIAAAPADVVLVQVGQSSFSASELRAWLARTPLGTSDATSTPEGKTSVAERRKRAVLTMALLTENGRTLSAKGDPALRDRVLASALERELRAKQTPTPADIQRFYDEHQDRYREPRAIRVWRILVADEERAKEIIEAVNGKPKAVYLWGDQAREHSLDEATKQRDGSLGFVRDDGSTDVPELRVDRALFAAADAVSDGQLVPTPVVEGPNFAVVWRRGTRPARAQTLEQERANIREILVRSAAQAARTELLAQLRGTALSDFHPDALPEATPEPAKPSASVSAP
jgi:hypothetical protein